MAGSLPGYLHKSPFRALELSGAPFLIKYRKAGVSVENIFYKPRLEPEKDFQTEKALQSTFIQEEPIVPGEPTEGGEEEPSSSDWIVDNKEQIPEWIQKEVVGSLNLIKQEIANSREKIKDQESREFERQEEESKEDYSQEPSALDDLLLPLPELSKEELFREKDSQSDEQKYLKLLEDMMGHFSEQLKNILQQNRRSKLLASIESGMPLYEQDYSFLKPTALVEKDFAHLSDAVQKLPIVRDQKQRILKKIFNERETKTHLDRCRATKAQRHRYYDIYMSHPNTFLEAQGNDLLIELRIAYDKKYQESMYSLYKYLNSAVIIMNECHIAEEKEIIAKSLLYKTGQL